MLIRWAPNTIGPIRMARQHYIQQSNTVHWNAQIVLWNSKVRHRQVPREWMDVGWMRCPQSLQLTRRRGVCRDAIGQPRQDKHLNAINALLTIK